MVSCPAQYLVKSPSMRRAGRSQVCSFVFSLDKVFFPAELPLSATLPSALFDERFFARCKLGVLVSAGAATCLSTCSSILKNGSWARRLTQSPELDVLGFVFPFLECFKLLLASPSGCCFVRVRILLRSPT